MNYPPWRSITAYKYISSLSVWRFVSIWGWNSRRHAGFQGIPGDYTAAPGSMAMGFPPAGYTPAMPSHPAGLRHGPSLHSYLPGHPHHASMILPAGASPHHLVSAQSPADALLNGQNIDIHAH